jgi:hypothetical protein
MGAVSRDCGGRRRRGEQALGYFLFATLSHWYHFTSCLLRSRAIPEFMATIIVIGATFLRQARQKHNKIR